MSQTSALTPVERQKLSLARYTGDDHTRAVEQIVRDHEQSIREQIAQALEDAAVQERRAGFKVANQGGSGIKRRERAKVLRRAARIARGGDPT